MQRSERDGDSVAAIWKLAPSEHAMSEHSAAVKIPVDALAASCQFVVKLTEIFHSVYRCRIITGQNLSTLKFLKSYPFKMYY